MTSHSSVEDLLQVSLQTSPVLAGEDLTVGFSGLNIISLTF